MKLSQHAQKRQQQRGISRDIIELILVFGTPRHKPGNATEYLIMNEDNQRLSNDLKRVKNLLEKAKNKAVLVSKDGNDVITTYHMKN